MYLAWVFYFIYPAPWLHLEKKPFIYNSCLIFLIFIFKRLLLCDKMMLMVTMLTLLVAPMLFFQSTGGQALKSALFRRTSNISATNFSVHILQNLLLFLSKIVYIFFLNRKFNELHAKNQLSYLQTSTTLWISLTGSWNLPLFSYCHLQRTNLT